MSYFRVYIFETEDNKRDVIQTYYIDPFTCRDDEDPYEFINKFDNGSLISTGLWYTKEKMKWFRELCAEWGVKIRKCSYDEANHSGCLTYCIRRGDKTCTY